MARQLAASAVLRETFNRRAQSWIDLNGRSQDQNCSGQRIKLSDDGAGIDSKDNTHALFGIIAVGKVLAMSAA